jgi:alkylation response protein AidB-like acyl-CoA dehydrogenase
LHDREGSYAPENIDALWAAGLGNLNLPVELGGLGADLATTGRVVEAIATGDASTALIYVMHLAHLGMITQSDGPWPEVLRQKVIADSLAGPALINALRVEPELGTPARGGVPATIAERDRDSRGQPVWRISGRKIYSTGSRGLKWMVEIVPTWDHLGMGASASYDVVFQVVVIPFDHAIGLIAPGARGPEAAGPNVALWGWTSVLLLSIYTGVAKAGRDWLAGYLNERKPTNLGASLATLPRFQAAVGEIEALIFTSDRLVQGLAEQIDAGGQGAVEAAQRAGLIKVVVTGNVIKALEQALALIGNPGLSYHHPLQRHYRNALCSRIHTPQDDAVLTTTGKAILGQ